MIAPVHVRVMQNQHLQFGDDRGCARDADHHCRRREAPGRLAAAVVKSPDVKLQSKCATRSMQDSPFEGPSSGKFLQLLDQSRLSAR